MAAKKQKQKGKRLTVAEQQKTIHEQEELRGLDYLAVEWMEPDNLLLLECWARDGYTLKDVSARIGISHYTLIRWRKKFAPIQKALSQGREIIDYKVENALLKAALGYKTSELKVTTTVEDGVAKKVVTERTEKEQAPNIYAIQSWLYNRCPDKWKKNRDQVIQLNDDDQSIEVTVVRGSKNPTSDKAKANPEEEEQRDWDEALGVEEEPEDEVNSSISIRRKSTS